MDPLVLIEFQDNIEERGKVLFFFHKYKLRNMRDFIK